MRLGTNHIVFYRKIWRINYHCKALVLSTAFQLKACNNEPQFAGNIRSSLLPQLLCSLETLYRLLERPESLALRSAEYRLDIVQPQLQLVFV